MVSMPLVDWRGCLIEKVVLMEKSGCMRCRGYGAAG